MSGHRRIICDISNKHCYVADIAILGYSDPIPDCVDEILSQTDLVFGDAVLYKSDNKKLLLNKGKVQIYDTL